MNDFNGILSCTHSGDRYVGALTAKAVRVLQLYYAKADINTEHRRRPTDCGLSPAFVWGNVKFSILKAAKDWFGSARVGNVQWSLQSRDSFGWPEHIGSEGLAL